MKTTKFLLTIISLIFIICSFSLAVIQDFWDDGWDASSGLNTMDGIASNVSQVPGGYQFYCVGGGICYTINGPYLTINDGFGGTGVEVGIQRRL